MDFHDGSWKYGHYAALERGKTIILLKLSFVLVLADRFGYVDFVYVRNLKIEAREAFTCKIVRYMQIGHAFDEGTQRWLSCTTPIAAVTSKSSDCLKSGAPRPPSGALAAPPRSRRAP
jgi:hypothetical protein